ncbi:MAG: energy-coupling factor ABC transporter permease, partial [Deltaproteobacteria bacterium]|nr:energy-coupling factor ABC transporter permease [Deltaproteobacteria bacterium]
SWICILMVLLSLLPLLLALRNLGRGMTREKARQYAMLAAAIFAAQMLNFPVAGGTSGHFLGAALAVMLFGVDAAVLIIASVLLVQAAAFGDGGMLTLGANIFNMAVVGGYAAHFAYQKTNNRFIASWASVVAASLSCALLLGVSGTVMLVPALIAMASVHAIIGVGEGMVTSVLLSCSRNRIITRVPGALVFGACFFALALLLPFASAEPDGLERIAINLGFYQNAMTIYAAPFADYALPLADTNLSALMAGLVGMVLVAAAMITVMTMMMRTPGGVPVVSAPDAAYRKE